MVYVLNMRGQPLMPMTQAKANRLLQAGKAKVVKRFPFTIQLQYPTGEAKQEIKLGIDSGYGNIGFSAVSDKKELIAGTLKLDGKTSERLTERRIYRRVKRNKLWYRKSRFDNRKKPEGWLPPSVQRRYDTHVNLVTRVKKLLPITRTIVEAGLFDIQKILNPDIEGKEYQQGKLQGNTVFSYLYQREHGKCQLCYKEQGGDKFATHHIIPRAEGGTNRVDNLALLHEKCHKRLHKLGLASQLKKNKVYKGSTFMNIIRLRFKEDLDCEIVYGVDTNFRRRELILDKSHVNDAFVVAGGSKQLRTDLIQITQRHRNNRSLQLNRNGYAPSIRRQRYSIQPGDFFWIKEIKYTCKGVFNYGKSILYGNIKKKEYFKMGLIEKMFNNGSLIWNRAFHPVN